MADRLAGGNLEATLRAHRATGLPFEAISQRLFAEFKVEISGQTVRNWCAELGVPSPTPQPQDAA